MLVEAIRRFFEVHRIEPCRIAAAVSGGVDSTALLIALAEFRGNGFDVVAAHVNHHLRGAESEGDEAFVRDLCSRFAVSLSVGDGPLDPERVRHVGVEAAAREIRTRILKELAEAAGAPLIATAHQKNDQAETVLMRLFTGSGIRGLRAIHPVRDDGFIRPLLEVTRAEIESFLRDRGIDPRFDRMNGDPRFLRVRIRQMLRNFETSVIDNLSSVAAQAREQWPLLERAIDDAERACAEVGNDTTRFRCWPDDRWLIEALLHRHIRRLDPDSRDVSSADLRRIASELDSLKRLHVTKSLELIRDGNDFVLQKIRTAADAVGYELALRSGGEVFIPAIESVLTIQRAASTEAKTTDRTRQLIQLPPRSDPEFTIRNRRPGDRFQPLGLAAGKKLKDLLIDRKVPASQRDLIPLVIWRGAIAWVAGVEVSESFKVDGRGDVYEVTVRAVGSTETLNVQL